MGISTTRLPIPIKTIFNAKGETGIGNNINVQDFQHCIFAFATDGGGDAALTVKFQGSISETAPDFSANQSVTNMWDFIQTIDLEDGSTKDGDTGVAVATADDYRLFEANINGLKWINARITARTAGELTITMRVFNNA